ncbi:MAG: transcription elongation factor GreA [Candidatus Omnitrophota bacterium]
MSSNRITLTRAGRDKICRELEVLKGEKRRAIARALDEARSQGDLSENAEYDAAKEAQAHNEKKISELEDTLMRAQLLDETNISKDEALLGANVKVRDVDSNEEFEYILVSAEESDFNENKISLTSPVGKALLGHKIGEIVEVSVPVGTIKYEIIGISR